MEQATASFECPACNKKFKGKPGLAGKKIKCPQCGQLVVMTSSKPRPAREGATVEESPTLMPRELPPATQMEVSSVEPGASPDEELLHFLAPPQQPDELGRLGHYRILKVLGAGGMGVVFRAEDTQLDRIVALKAMLPSLASSPASRKRFVREAKAAAGLKHDHVVAIFQVGEDRGAPYLAMEFLEGESLDDRVKREGKLAVPEVVRIGREIADALGFAHERGLVHRDIKPANVWLECRGDASPRVKILDFGLARGQDDRAHLTQSGAIIGTPAYMAPEQASGQTVDGRSDVFSLGCVLYRMTTGQMPFKGNDTISTLMAVATEDPVSPHELNPSVPESLSSLIMQLLAKKPADRPQTREVVAALRALEGDVGTVRTAERQRPLRTAIEVPAGRRTSAGGDATLAVANKTHSSHRRTIVLIAGAVGALVVLAAGVFLATRVFGHREQTSESSSSRSSSSSPIVAGSVLDRLDADKIPEQDRLKGLPSDKVQLVGLLGENRVHLAGEIIGLALDPQGKIVATRSAGDNGTKVRLTDSETLREIGVIDVPQSQDSAHALVFSPDGSLLAIGGDKGSLILWDVRAKKQAQVVEGHSQSVTSAAFTRDGSLLLSTGQDGFTSIWSVKERKKTGGYGSHATTVTNVATSADDKLAVTAGDGKIRDNKDQFLDDDLHLWNVESRGDVRKFKGHTSPIVSLAWSPDGNIIATGEGASKVHLWSAATGNELFSSGAEVACLAFSPDSKYLLSGGGNSIRLWDAEKKKQRFQWTGFDCRGLAFFPDSRRFVCSAGKANTLKIFDIETTKELKPPFGHTAAVRSVAFLPGARQLLSSGGDETLRLWDLESAHELEPFPALASNPTAPMALSPTGRYALTVHHNYRELRLWDVARRKDLRSIPLADATAIVGIQFSGEDQLAWVVDFKGNMRCWDVENAKVVKEASVDKQQCNRADVSVDGRRAIVSVVAGSQLWDLEKSTMLRSVRLGDAGSKYSSAVFTRDNSLVYVGCQDGSVELCDVNSVDAKSDVVFLRYHRDPVTAMALSPSGKTLVSADQSGHVVVWNTATRKMICEWDQPGAVLDLAFAPGDERHIATANANGTIYILRLNVPKE